jgi:ribosome modulation factor
MIARQHPHTATAAEIREAWRRGRCAYAEGEPGHLNPHQEPEQRQAWQGGWWQGFMNAPPKAKGER